MAAAGVVGVLLPTVTLSLRSQAWGHAAVLREAGVELALATDCNPGTSWCESMPCAIQLACLAMGLSVAEAFRAATVGAAHSLRRDDVGHLGVGAHGDLAVLDAEHEADVVAHLGGRAGDPHRGRGRAAALRYVSRASIARSTSRWSLLLALGAHRVGAAEEVDERAGRCLQQCFAVG